MGNFFFIFGKILKTMFGFRKVLRKEKKILRKMIFLYLVLVGKIQKKIKHY